MRVLSPILQFDRTSGRNIRIVSVWSLPKIVDIQTFNPATEETPDHRSVMDWKQADEPGYLAIPLVCSNRAV